MKAKLDHANWDEILGTSTINGKSLGFRKYIKKTEDEFIPHRLVSNIKGNNDCLKSYSILHLVTPKH